MIVTLEVDASPMLSPDQARRLVREAVEIGLDAQPDLREALGIHAGRIAASVRIIYADPPASPGWRAPR